MKNGRITPLEGSRAESQRMNQTADYNPIDSTPFRARG